MPYQCRTTTCIISSSGAIFPSQSLCPVCKQSLTPIKEPDHSLPPEEGRTTFSDHFRIQNIANSIPGALVVYRINSDGTDDLLYVSDQVEALWGIPKHRALKNVGLIWKTIHSEDLPSVQVSIQKSAEALSFWNHVWRINSKGTVRWLNGRGYPVKDDNGAITWNSIILDVTDFKETQNELRYLNNDLEDRVKKRTKALAMANQELINSQMHMVDTNKQLQDALEELKRAELQLIRSEKMASLGVMTAGMSHELNNPLNYISGGILGIRNHLLERTDVLDEDLQHLFETMEEGVKRVTEIVKSLNQFSATTQKKDKPCDIHKIIINCLSVLRHRMKYENEILTDLAFIDKPYELFGNESKLHQLFVNIILNAIQAMEGRGNLQIETCLNEHSMFISIRDNGTGIEEEIMDQIMDPFFTTKDPGKGTGLGLSIAYAIVQEHDGDLKIKSALGEGTEVIIRLPINQKTFS